ncbi:hypothetical protein EDB83DRAFT_1226018 [Lactarius deliciosus]|nr:hypothetical protein EDB83DRAFT_183329 [Lactarius deliciosus]KAH9051595.1 hypothetical protein EDB83DRAFT_1226018 [Lactarius deliciosus]
MAEATTEINRSDWSPADRAHLLETSRSWLSPPDPSENYVVLCRDIRKGSQAATWFIQGDLFEKWKVMGCLLWIHGKPGSGKSMLRGHHFT